MSGPPPTCDCGSCPTCLKRAASLRAYHRQRGRAVPKIPQGFRTSRLRLPDVPEIHAYIAGIVDGEGCITRQNKNWRLQVGMTDQGLIEWLGEIGGTVKERRVQGNRQRCWLWLVMAQMEVREILTALLPYLRVKRVVAEEPLREIDARIAVRDEAIQLAQMKGAL